MLKKSLKRFYKQAAIAEVGGGFAIHLDGRAIKTPLGKPLVVPSGQLAEAIAAEWQAQGDIVLPLTMPLTQLASTALDRVGPDRAIITAELVKYAGTDLLCYRADFPPDLVERQARQWQPILDWARTALAAEMVATCGVIAIAQPTEAMTALTGKLESYEVWRLTAVQLAAAAMGSLLLALALAERRLTGAEAFALSQLDETYQIEQWGEDAEAAQRREALKADVLAAERLLALLD